jgi:hypothetical protein
MSAVKIIAGFINMPYRVPTATADRTSKAVNSRTERSHISVQVFGKQVQVAIQK